MVQAPECFNRPAYSVGESDGLRINNIKFNLSSIIRHVSRLRVNNIIAYINDFNETHENKINDKYIKYFKDFDYEVLLIIVKLFNYAEQQDEDNYTKCDLIIDIRDAALNLAKNKLFQIYSELKEEDIDEDIDEEDGEDNGILCRLGIKQYNFLNGLIGYEPPGIINNVKLSEEYLREEFRFDKIWFYKIVIDI